MAVSRVRRIRCAVLSPLFRLLIGSSIWSDHTKERYEHIFLSDDPVSLKEQTLVRTATSFLERTFLRLYLTIPFPFRDKGYHVDVHRYIILKLHSFCGLVDPTLQTDIDDLIYSSYDPLRHYMATNINEDDDISDDDGTSEDDATSEDNGEDHGESQHVKTLPVFRLARHFVTVKSLTCDIFKGVTRPVNVLSDQELSNLYYDVLQSRQTAIANQYTRERILAGEISVIALSYRYASDHRDKMGITKRELIAALRALHAEAQQANPPSEYCLWWDRCLRCSSKNQDATPVNWAAVGLVPYAFCHVLSIRRASERTEQRLWIDMERALARLSKGMTAVDVSDVNSRRGTGSVKVLGIATGAMCDPEWALYEGLKYLMTGDLSSCEVSFEIDKILLERAGTLLLCGSLSLGVYRALFDSSRTRVEWVESWADLEERAFETGMLVRLGKEQVIDGDGEAFLDVAIEIHGDSFPFDDRRNWFPNSPIYNLETGDEAKPLHVKNQSVLLLLNPDPAMLHCKFGVLLYHRTSTDFVPEAIHGCVVNLVEGHENSLKTESVSRLHVPANSGLLPSFRDLHSWSLQNRGAKVPFLQLGDLQEAVEWLWQENQMDSDTERVVVEVCTSERA